MVIISAVFGTDIMNAIRTPDAIYQQYPYPTTECVPQRQSASPIADPVNALPFFVGKVTMEVLSFEENIVELYVTNNSEKMIYFFLELYAIYNNRHTGRVYTKGWSVEIEYFDGYEWRLIPHSLWTTEPRARLLEGTHGPIYLAPGNSTTIKHSLAYRRFPRENFTDLHRIRKFIHFDITEINAFG